MQRDMDIVREIVLETAKLPSNSLLTGLDNVDRATFAMHVTWMQEAGLLAASVQEYSSGEPPRARVIRLTWAGCDFADAIQSDTLWAKAKANVFKPGISFTFDVLKDWLKAEITQGLPTVGKLI